MKTFFQQLLAMGLCVFVFYFMFYGSPIKASPTSDDLCEQMPDCIFFRYTNKHDAFVQYADEESILDAGAFDTLNVSTFEIPACRCEEVRAAIQADRFRLKVDL